ncbi:hypothetical protein [Eikenella sp. NML01-A-086]|uniref:hypothetical protein n=1 Tax=Eikenella sp. NML01-A-086 TaxID=1795826 RepID=UPI000B2088AF|nr:hypothetical protein [Eikenella sp. NML01-A-086]
MIKWERLPENFQVAYWDKPSNLRKDYMDSRRRYSGTARHGTARHGTARHGTARHGTARHGTARHGTARHGTARHGTAIIT